MHGFQKRFVAIGVNAVREEDPPPSNHAINFDDKFRRAGRSVFRFVEDDKIRTGLSDPEGCRSNEERHFNYCRMALLNCRRCNCLRHAPKHYSVL